jgi:hypothetical protein
MFYIKKWGTDEILGEYKKLAIAKKYARGAGHTGEIINGLNGYPPIAYVANERGECVYNPRFGKNISSAVSGLVHSADDCLRG